MNRLETTIADRLHAAASRLDVDVDAVLTGVERRRAAPPPTEPARPARRRSALLAAAATVVLAVVAAGLLAARYDGRETDLGTGGRAASHAAHAEAPPGWFGEPRGALRDGGVRAGRWSAAAFGRRTASGGLNDPIIVAAVDGGYRALDGAERVVVDGTPLRLVHADGWTAVATEGDPFVVAVGGGPEADLVSVVTAARIGASGALIVGDAPDGYSRVVDAVALGDDASLRRTLASGDRRTGINEVSDWVDPLLYAASTGADLEPVDVAGASGWAGRTTSNHAGPLRFLVWSPAPGVVFEITTADERRTTADLVDLATTVTPLPLDAWEDRYGR